MPFVLKEVIVFPVYEVLGVYQTRANVPHPRVSVRELEHTIYKVAMSQVRIRTAWYAEFLRLLELP